MDFGVDSLVILWWFSLDFLGFWLLLVVLFGDSLWSSFLLPEVQASFGKEIAFRIKAEVISVISMIPVEWFQWNRLLEFLICSSKHDQQIGELRIAFEIRIISRWFMSASLQCKLIWRFWVKWFDNAHGLPSTLYWTSLNLIGGWLIIDDKWVDQRWCTSILWLC